MSTLTDFQKDLIQTYYEDGKGVSITQASEFDISGLLETVENSYELLTSQGALIGYTVNLDHKFMGWPGENALTFMINAQDGQNMIQEKARELLRNQQSHLFSKCPYIKSFGEPVIKN